MKVVHITTVHHPKDTRIYFKECITLYSNGYEVHLICSSTNKINDEYINFHLIPVYNSHIKRFLFSGIKAYIIAKNLNADIYHFHDPEFIPWAWLLSFKKTSVIYDMHENVLASLKRKEYLCFILKIFFTKLFKIIEKICLKRMLIIFAEDSYRKYYTNRPDGILIRNFPRLDILNKISHPKKQIFTVVYLGAIIEERCCFIILDAISKLRAQGKEINCIFIGPDGNSDPSIFPKRVSSSDGVEWFGRLPPEEAWEIVSTCHLGIALFYPMPNLIESYPTKVFEYMALGLPSIVSNFPLYLNLISDGLYGEAIPPGDVDSLVKAIDKYYVDRSLLRNVSNRCMADVKKLYSWESESLSLLKLYKDISLKSNR